MYKNYVKYVPEILPTKYLKGVIFKCIPYGVICVFGTYANLENPHHRRNFKTRLSLLFKRADDIKSTEKTFKC